MGQEKFGRNYHLSVQQSDGKFLEIDLPFTIEFTVIRRNIGAPALCDIRIYNLGEKSRNLIRYDVTDTSTVRKVQLNAGYGTNLPLIFIGNIQQAWSVREGTDFITTIQSFGAGDGYVNANIPSSATYPAGTPWLNVYKNLIGYIPNVTPGAIGVNFIYDKNKNLLLLNRSNSYSGNAISVLKDLTGGAFFVDNNQCYILRNSDYIDGQVPIINAQSGLLNTPVREVNVVSFDMIFEPGLILGQYIDIESSTFPAINSISLNKNNNVNGPYVVQSITHRAIISPVVCGDAITSVEFYGGLTPLTRAVNIL